MAIVAGGSEWKAVPGTKRARFVAVSGPYVDQEATRRGLENIRAQQRGLPSYRTYQDLRSNSEYQRLLGMYAGATKTRRVEVRKSASEFTKLFAAAYVRSDGTIRTMGETLEEAYRDPSYRTILGSLLTELGFFRNQADFQRYIAVKR